MSGDTFSNTIGRERGTEIFGGRIEPHAKHVPPKLSKKQQGKLLYSQKQMCWWSEAAHQARQLPYLLVAWAPTSCW